MRFRIAVVGAGAVCGYVGVHLAPVVPPRHTRRWSRP